jgi:glucose/arabinose dehydrogenase
MKHLTHPMKTMLALALLGLVPAALGTLVAQTPEPKPAFAGQTDAPAPPPSAPFQTQIVTERLNAPWSLAFLPDGNFLVTDCISGRAAHHEDRTGACGTGTLEQRCEAC